MKLKKTDIALIIAVVVVIIIGAFVMKGGKVEKGNGSLKKLSYAEYQEKVDNNETFMFIVERTSCSHCQNFMPVAERFAKAQNITMYYIDTDEMGEEDWEKLPKSNSFFKEKGDEWGTPTTMVLTGSKVLEYIEGETTVDELKKLYKKYFNLDNNKSE